MKYVLPYLACPKGVLSKIICCDVVNSTSFYTVPVLRRGSFCSDFPSPIKRTRLFRPWLNTKFPCFVPLQTLCQRRKRGVAQCARDTIKRFAKKALLHWAVHYLYCICYLTLRSTSYTIRLILCQDDQGYAVGSRLTMAVIVRAWWLTCVRGISWQIGGLRSRETNRRSRCYVRGSWLSLWADLLVLWPRRWICKNAKRHTTFVVHIKWCALELIMLFVEETKREPVPSKPNKYERNKRDDACYECGSYISPITTSNWNYAPILTLSSEVFSLWWHGAYEDVPLRQCGTWSNKTGILLRSKNET